MNTVEAAVIHKLDKEQRGGKSDVTLRDKLNDLSPKVTKLVLDINELYAKKSNKGYGRFQADQDAFPVSRMLHGYYDGVQADFLTLSRELVGVLAARADQQPMAKGGYVLMAQISGEGGSRWFLVAIINNVDGSAVDENLDVIETFHVDLEHLRVAGRVNVRDWLEVEGHARYVGFLKQRGDVAEYFKAFLGCDDLVVPTVETKSLTQSLKAFAAEQKLDFKREDEFLKAAHAYCDQRAQDKEPLSLDALANAAWPDEPELLKAKFAQDGAQISDGFIPDPLALRRMLKVRARTDAWSIELDLSALASGDAQYVPDEQGLLLRNLPPELLELLEREHKGKN